MLERGPLGPELRHSRGNQLGIGSSDRGSSSFAIWKNRRLGDALLGELLAGENRHAPSVQCTLMHA